MVERRTRDQKVSVRFPTGAAGEFSSPGSTFCADSYCGIRFTLVLPLWCVKDPVIQPEVQVQVTAKHTCTLAWNKVTL